MEGTPGTGPGEEPRWQAGISLPLGDAPPPRGPDFPAPVTRPVERGILAHRTTRRAVPRPPRKRPAAELDPELAAQLHAREAAAQPDPAEANPAPARPDLDESPIRMVDGMVQVELPFRVDVVALSGHLMREGYPLAYGPGKPDDEGYEPELPGTQGWGPSFDPEGYYPYWVMPAPGNPSHSVFAFPPRPDDLILRRTANGTAREVELGPESQRLLNRWLPALQSYAVREGELT